MLICTPNRRLHVLQIMQQEKTIVTYVCTDMSEDESELYLLNGFLKTETYKKLIPLILKQKKVYFTDFIESFSAEGIFYLLFRYKKGVPLFKQCRYENMEQRLEYTRLLIEQMVLQDMPVMFQYAVLLPERIWITDDKKIQFYYQLPDSLGQDTITFHDMELRLLETIQELLHHEIKMKYSESLLDFCKSLQNGNVFCNYAEIYAAFSAVNQEFKNQKGNLISKKYRFQLWESCKKHSKKIWRCFVFFVAVASVIFLIYENFINIEKKETDSKITQIGTLIIKENQPAETTKESEEESQ